jgi:fatty-acyl-CoA synthase
MGQAATRKVVMNIGDWIKKWSLISPSKIAVIDDGKEFSYGELNERTNRVANYLLRKGLNKGDIVAVLSSNCHEFIEIYFGSAKTGAAFVPVNWRMSPNEIAYILNDCSPKFLFFAQDFSETVLALRDEVNSIEHYVVLGQDGFAWAETYTDLQESPGGEPQIQGDLEFEDIHIILYTSGTTGVPKGVTLSTRKTFYNALNADIFFRLTPNDVFLVSRPLFHSGGLLIDSTPAFYKGATVIYKKRFTPQQYLDTIAKYRVSVIEPAATFLNFVLKECDLGRCTLTSLKSLYTGGERVAVTLLKEYHERGLPLSQLFGMTETSTLTWLSTDDAFDKAGSVGKPVFHGQIEIVNKESQRVSPGEIGEMRVRGPILMSGYWKKPEETAAVMKNGWFCTGDLATIDDQGFMYIVDRAKDMYISGGENIHPAEIENLLLTNPKIFDVAVYGVPDEKWGQVGKATVVLKDGQNLTAEEVLDFLRGRIGRFKIPRYVDFDNELPRTASGKIKRYVMIENFNRTNLERDKQRQGVR